MTERGLAHSDGAIACPFVAFEDDRDERSDRPDHRHRCYAESPPAPRAIAHQEAYCLASAFAVCPTFQDWAQREAARTRGAAGSGVAVAQGSIAPQPEPDTGAGSAAREAAREERPEEDGADEDVVPADEWRAGRQPPVEEQRPAPLPPRRNPPRDWAAPPPWAGTAAGGGAGAAAGGGAAGAGRRGGASEPGAPGFLADRESRGLAGSAADRLASGESFADRPTEPPRDRPTDPIRGDERPRGVERPRGDEPPTRPTDPPSRGVEPPSRPIERVSRGGQPPIAAPSSAADEELADLVRSSRIDRDEDTTRYRAPEERAAERRARAARASNGEGPAWEEPRRFEAYPTIKSRSGAGGLPRLGIMVAALALAALVLFALPGLLGWFGSNENNGALGPGASATPTAPAETASPSPTVPPEPTPQVYVIRQGDTLSKIANRFGITLDDLLAANEDTIKNPDRISVGDQIIIPVPAEEE